MTQPEDGITARSLFAAARKNGWRGGADVEDPPLPLSAWPVEELVIELAQRLAELRTRRAVYDAAKADGKERAVGDFTFDMRIYQGLPPVWKEILGRGGTIPARLRQQYMEAYGTSPEWVLWGEHLARWRKEIDDWLASTRKSPPKRK